MYAGMTLGAIWICILLIILIVLVYANVQLFHKLIETNKEAKKEAELIIKTAENKVNKYASMTPDELNQFLISIFSQELELVSTTSIAENDPDASAKLYGMTVTKVLSYIGETSIQAIDAYYGQDYIIRWCELRYKLLENRGMLRKIINKDVYSENVAKELE